MTIILQVEIDFLELDWLWHIISVVCWVGFVGDVVIQWMALRKNESYWSMATRRFDFFSAIATGIMLLPGIYNSYAYRYLVVFQVGRNYKYVVIMKELRKIIKSAFGNGADLLNATVFFLVMLSIVATINMQIFGGRFGFLDNIAGPNANFDTFPEAFLTTFQIMVSDNWTDPLYSALLSQFGRPFAFTIASLALITTFVIVHYITVDLAVSVLLDNFELEEHKKKAG